MSLPDFPSTYRKDITLHQPSHAFSQAYSGNNVCNHPVMVAVAYKHTSTFDSMRVGMAAVLHAGATHITISSGADQAEPVVAAAAPGATDPDPSHPG